jgi:hypothetical protein
MNHAEMSGIQPARSGEANVLFPGRLHRQLSNGTEYLWGNQSFLPRYTLMKNPDNRLASPVQTTGPLCS